jgi:hypothetical protein
MAPSGLACKRQVLAAYKVYECVQKGSVQIGTVGERLVLAGT